MKLSALIAFALVGYVISQSTGSTSGSYNLLSTTTYNCVDSTNLVCAPCSTYQQKVYQYSTNSLRLKTENTCTSCQTGSSTGAVTTEYYTNGTVISGKFVTSGSQLCNPPSGQPIMSGYTPTGMEITGNCVSNNATGFNCGICQSYAGQYYKRDTYGSTDQRISYRCTSCTGGKKPRGIQVFQTVGTGYNVTTNWNVGDKTCGSFSLLFSLTIAYLYGSF